MPPSRLIHFDRNVSGNLRCGTRTGAFRLDVPCQGAAWAVTRKPQSTASGTIDEIEDELVNVTTIAEFDTVEVPASLALGYGQFAEPPC